MCEHYIENALIVSILVRQTLCLMQVHTEKETHTATSGHELTTDHWGGESDALYSPSMNSQCGVGGFPGSDQDGVHRTVARRGHGQDMSCAASRPCQCWGTGSLLLGPGAPSSQLWEAEEAVVWPWC